MSDPRHGKDFADFVRAGKFDFLDFGCSHGGSIARSKRYFSGKQGLGIDIDSKKIQSARENGFDVIKYDIHNMPDLKLVRFTVMSHFLEHLPDYGDVQTFITKACQVSREFVFIKQPFFDADGYLFDKGLKLFWSDWHGHPNNMTVLQLYRVLEKLRKQGLFSKFSLHGKVPILSSSAPEVHPLTAAEDQHQYEPQKHPPKPMDIQFDMPIFYETVAFLSMDGADHSRICAQFPTDQTFVESDGTFCALAGRPGADQ